MSELNIKSKINCSTTVECMVGRGVWNDNVGIKILKKITDSNTISVGKSSVMDINVIYEKNVYTMNKQSVNVCRDVNRAHANGDINRGKSSWGAGYIQSFTSSVDSTK